MKRLTPIKAIRGKCLDCMGNHYKEIRECSSIRCELHPFRMGKRPTEDYYLKINAIQLEVKNEA